MITPSGTGLYIHFPWCERKCPYCDFNSHVSGQALPEAEMVTALINDYTSDLEIYGARPIDSLFIGGGTPSLISAQSIARLLDGIDRLTPLSDTTEITMEANPGSSEQEKFAGYRAAGVNRLSIGIQSFNSEHLRRLGRIHSRDEADHAIKAAQAAGFERINIDLMYGLPDQTLKQALHDVEQGLSYNTGHLSWYQLTIEPNTVFYKQRPPLPDDDAIADIADEGEHFMTQSGLKRYEVSAFAGTGQECRHNVNYWRFGDYFGIGAGAHGKISFNDHIIRTAKQRMPDSYLQASDRASRLAVESALDQAQLISEFMLNALRLREGVEIALFQRSTGLAPECMHHTWRRLQAQGLMVEGDDRLQTTELGWRFLNTVIESFME
ncbi:Coproporphyrinogen III oxidase, oxygen-independent [Aequoribacter fuscus]|uniref:Heme chaperone HemW n=1 Tax=Aequoribacter fuscus TaxID=2518989 RepID=F3L3I9_9GAMM|nr:radical SAM family heme chaperone HemW [Aequoribacter fuscus]EGG29101.1 Coproporphyrinogen III oxidase, oxygen-independent [Aequoribacter fuscus]